VSAAILASSVAAAAQRTQTARRSDERDAVEGAVKALLESLAFRRVGTPRKGIQTLLAGGSTPSARCRPAGGAGPSSRARRRRTRRRTASTSTS
jgi:hypothetical protein